MGANRKGKWRNGRRARFRSVCPKGRGGSTPPLPTRNEPRSAVAGRGFFFAPPGRTTFCDPRADGQPRLVASEASTSGLPSRPVRRGPSWRCRGGGPEDRGPSSRTAHSQEAAFQTTFPALAGGDLYLLSQFVSTLVSKWEIFWGRPRHGPGRDAPGRRARSDDGRAAPERAMSEAGDTVVRRRAVRRPKW